LPAWRFGVFVVVSMGAVVKRHPPIVPEGSRRNRRDHVHRATSWQWHPGLRRTDEKCPDRRNPPISFSEWNMIERIPGVANVIGSLGGSGNFAYKNVRIDNGRFTTPTAPTWPQVDASGHQPGPQLHAHRVCEAGQPVVLVNDTLKTQLFGTSEPIGKADHDQSAGNFTSSASTSPRRASSSRLKARVPTHACDHSAASRRAFTRRLGAAG
jgi:putative ABC transport system permease protein